MLTYAMVEYHTNAEYRALFRQITGQPSLKSPPRQPEDDGSDEDEQTRDESTYDESCVSAFLETVYTDTRENALFQRLYLAAAAKMLTENPEIGLAIMMSYDYLWAFYPCYCAYRETPETFSEINEWYSELEKRLRNEP